MREHGGEEYRREYRVDEVFDIVREILHLQRHIMSALTDLQAAVAAATGMDGTAVATINALTAQVADLTKKLADAQAASGTPDSELTPLTDSLAAGTAALGAVATPVVPPAA